MRFELKRPFIFCKHEMCCQADENARKDTGKHHYRQIDENPDVLDHQTCDGQLCHIVPQGAENADADQA
jgi:hypothetical protein